MNPFLTKLNLPEDARAVVIHVDDLGMGYSTIAQFPDLLEAGSITSAAIMPPCPWFPGAANVLRSLHSHPRLDVGVHLTLNCEWENYRWGPVSAQGQDSGLLDEAGYFHHLEVQVWRHANVNAVETELRAQIERALAAGLDVTHIDSHMGTLFHPKLLDVYINLARAYRVPPFLMRPQAPHLQSYSLTADEARELERIVREVEKQGLPLFDHFHVTSLRNHENRLLQVRQVLEALPPGSMTYLILHPATDDPDLRAFAPDWRARVADQQLLSDPAFGRLLDELNIIPLGMRALRDAMRQEA